MDHVKDYSGKGPTYGVYVPELGCDINESGIQKSLLMLTKGLWSFLSLF